MTDLDKWIAENIMGWHLEKGLISNELDMWADEKGSHICGIDLMEWNPTESISDAFRVVDKMLFLHRQWLFEYKEFRKSVGVDTGRCRARFRYTDCGEPEWELAHIRPLAICLAAKAVIEGMK